MELVERDEPLDLLVTLTDQARDGHGRVVLVTGPVATGKSVLAHTFAEHAIDLGLLPVSALATDAEQHLTLGVMRQLMDDAPLPAADRARALALLDEGERGAAGTDQVEDGIVHALCTVLLELAERCPLFLVVDDVEHADRASLICLGYLARRIRGARVLALFTCARHGRNAEFRFETDLLRQPNCHRIELTQLSAAGVRALAARYLDDDVAERHAVDWHRYSGGNPLLVEALTQDHRDGVGVGVGRRYGQAVLSCLRRGRADMLSVANGFAVLGELHLLDSLLDLGPAKTTEAVHALITAGLLTMDGFRHPAARTAVLDAIDADELARLHARAAALAYERGATTSVIADHLLKAGPPSNAGVLDEVWVVPVLEDSARQAVRDGAAVLAVDCLRLAWRVCVDASRRVRITAALVQAEWNINPGVSTGHLSELTDALHKGYLRGADAVVLARALLWHGRFDQAREVLEHLTNTGADADPETATELLIARRWLSTTYPSLLGVLGPRAGAGRPTAHSVSADRRLRAISALAAVLTGGPRPQIVSAMEKVLRGAGLDEMSVETVETALLALTYSGAPDRAAPWCDLFLNEAAARHAPSRQARLAAVRAEIALRQGDLAVAHRHARAALCTMPATSWGVTVGGPLSTLVLATTAMGRYDEAQALLDQWVPDAMFETRYGAQYRYARARFELATGHLDLALEDLRRCGSALREWELDVPGLIPWRIDAAEAYLGLGRPAPAQRLLDEQSARFTGLPRRVRGAALRVLAGATEPTHRPMLLRQAADLLQADDGDRYELARTFADLARAYRTLSEFRRAAAAERRAVIVATDCHAGAVVRGLVAEIGPVPPASTGDDGGLTEGERRVAALAAVGCSNREIADDLHVTVSTVEQHLTRTYRKLNISRRTDLPALRSGLAAGGPAPESVPDADPPRR